VLIFKGGEYVGKITWSKYIIVIYRIFFGIARRYYYHLILYFIPFSRQIATIYKYRKKDLDDFEVIRSFIDMFSKDYACI